MPDPTYRWNEGKNAQLRTQRCLSFEAVESAIENGNLLDDIPHPNPSQFPRYRMLIVSIGHQVCVVPDLTDGSSRFLKTIYPSRKAKRTYAGTDA